MFRSPIVLVCFSCGRLPDPDKSVMTRSVFEKHADRCASGVYTSMTPVLFIVFPHSRVQRKRTNEQDTFAFVTLI